MIRIVLCLIVLSLAMILIVSCDDVFDGRYGIYQGVNEYNERCRLIARKNGSSSKAFVTVERFSLEDRSEDSSYHFYIKKDLNDRNVIKYDDEIRVTDAEGSELVLRFDGTNLLSFSVIHLFKEYLMINYRCFNITFRGGAK